MKGTVPKSLDICYLHLQQHSQLLFPGCSAGCHAAYKVFNFLHVLITFHGLASKHASLAISASKRGGQLVNVFFTYLKHITLSPGYLKGWRIF